MSTNNIKPRNFFLNQAHELARDNRDGGGGPPKIDLNIDWSDKAQSILRDFSRVRSAIDRSSDPIKNSHYYFLASPEPFVTKRTDNKLKNRRGLTSEEVPVDYAGVDSRVIQRIGFDLIYVTIHGDAVVHIVPIELSRLENSLKNISQIGLLEKIRWAYLKGFNAIPRNIRIDSEWIGQYEQQVSLIDAVISFQPLISRAEGENINLSIQVQLNKRANESLINSGLDYSGRRWLRGKFSKQTLMHLAENYFSIQSIREPYNTPLSVNSRPSLRREKKPERRNWTEQSVQDLPVVGILDSGVPKDHAELRHFRVGTFVHPDSPVSEATCAHGSLVASRVVFGDPDFHTGVNLDILLPECRFIDINIADLSLDENIKTINDQIVLPSIDACLGAFENVRVFNMSFSDHTPLAQHNAINRREKTFAIQDLDNLIFARDIIVVVAAGNSSKGLVPQNPYPQNYEDPAWGLGHWACSFNSLTCGSFVTHARPDGLGTAVGAPSPFCKTAPGLAESPKPDFSAAGGDLDERYHPQPGLGVYAMNDDSQWEDHSGTSFAAPLLARQCAIALHTLKKHCAPDVEPFGVTVKAFFALSALKRELPEKFAALALRTLGRGEATAEPLWNPSPVTALFLWQGVLVDHKEVARIQVPIPHSWRASAIKPIAEISVAWDSPVNAAVEKIYGCRKVTVHLRPTPDSDAIRPRRRNGMSIPETYPNYVRTYDLQGKPNKPIPNNEMWIVEIFYEQKILNPVGRPIAPQQRVGIAIRLLDECDTPVSPQAFIQALPISQNMVNLGQPSPVNLPVRIKT